MKIRLKKIIDYIFSKKSVAFRKGYIHFHKGKYPKLSDNPFKEGKKKYIHWHMGFLEAVENTQYKKIKKVKMITTDKHIFFWREAFSQWHKSKFTNPIHNIEFNCAEQHMMWCKAMLFGDTATAAKIMLKVEPRDHKALGREVVGYNQKIWDENKYEIVCNTSMLKFTQNNKLLAMLLDTGNRTLVEASPKDPIWGIGMEENEPGINDEANWRGENLLGYALTDTRDFIRNTL